MIRIKLNYSHQSKQFNFDKSNCTKQKSILKFQSNNFMQNPILKQKKKQETEQAVPNQQEQGQRKQQVQEHKDSKSKQQSDIEFKEQHQQQLSSSAISLPSLSQDNSQDLSLLAHNKTETLLQNLSINQKSNNPSRILQTSSHSKPPPLPKPPTPYTMYQKLLIVCCFICVVFGLSLIKYSFEIQSLIERKEDNERLVKQLLKVKKIIEKVERNSTDGFGIDISGDTSYVPLMADWWWEQGKQYERKNGRNKGKSDTKKYGSGDSPKDANGSAHSQVKNPKDIEPVTLPLPESTSLSQNTSLQLNTSQTQPNLPQTSPQPLNQDYQHQKRFSHSFIQSLVSNTNLSELYENEFTTIHGINRQTHLQAIKLLELNNEQICCQNASSMISGTNNQSQKLHIKRLIKQEREYYQKKYHIIHAKKQKQVRFCVIVPIYWGNVTTAYNNTNLDSNSYKFRQQQLLKRNLVSIISQNYDNYHVTYIDDASEYVQIKNQINEILQFNINLPMKKMMFVENMVNVERNDERKYALKNIYNAVHYECKDDEVVVLVDGDDALIGREVLSVLNAVYQEPVDSKLESSKPLIVYSKYLQIENDRVELGTVSKPLRPDHFIDNKLRQSKTFFTSHLLTFSAGLFKQISQKDLKDSPDRFFQTAYDVAIMTPMLEMAYPRVKYLPQILYEYHYDGVSNDRREDQLKASKIVFEEKQKYQKLGEDVIEKFLQ